MEEKEFSGNIDHPEILSPSPTSPTTDVHDATGSAALNSREAEAQKPALSQRLTEAFREGVDSARPDLDQRPDVKIPPRAKKNRQESSDAGVLDRVIQGGGSVAAGVGDKAAGVLGGFVQLVKKAPAMTQKYAEAFREGAASVKPRASKERREEGPTAAKAKGAVSDGRAILDRLFKAGASAAGFVREAVSVVKPGEVFGAGQKIRLGRKKINQLYIDIGGEAVNSWSDGLVETEKLAALLDELRRSEEEIQTMQTHLSEVATAGKTAAARSSQRVKKEAAVTPATEQEDIRVDTDDSGAMLDEPVDHIDHLDHSGVDQPLLDNLEEKGALPEPENRADVTLDPDITPEVGALSVPVASDSEALESYAVHEDQVDAETALEEESDGGVESASPALPEEPDLKKKKKTGAKK